jgi:hypothetical protein
LTFIKTPSENHCPGISDFIRPKVEYATCKKCGGRVEIWTDEETGTCIDCGANFQEKDRIPPCLEYCDYAGVCKGIIMKKRNQA